MPTYSYSETVVPVIRRVREMLMPHYGKVLFRDKQPTAIQDALTKLDISVERFLKDEFAKLYPDISFVGEEDGGDRASERFWLVDPIDGTTYFVRGLPFCTTMVALIEKGEVIFSAIYDFVNDVMYSAEKGLGAKANGEPIHVSDRSLRQALLTVYMNLDDSEYLRSFLLLKKRCHNFRVGASGIEFVMIASGKLDGALYCAAGSKDYDVAPGIFLVSEAGGKVANIGTATYDYKNLNFIAANQVIFAELTQKPEALFPIQKPQ